MTVSPLEMLERAVVLLKPLKRRFVFLGGATVALHLDDPSGPGIRVTKDVDCVVEIANYPALSKLEEALREAGFEQRMDMEGPICRWSYDELIFDIMPTKGELQGLSNRWFREAFANAEERQLPSGETILVVDLIHLLATKIEAFRDRGDGDLLLSHDFEDIVMLLDGSSRLFTELHGESKVHGFVQTWFRDQLEDEDFIEMVVGHLPGGGFARAEVLLERLSEVVKP